MRKKKWALLFLCIFLIAGYYLLFYKTYNVQQVAASTDCVVSLDVKRIRNTVMWNTLTTPSQWKKVSLSKSKEVGWRDMFRIPDYVFIFHCAGQPSTAWFTVLTIKDDAGFEKGLRRFGFIKDTGNQLSAYYSTKAGVAMIRHGDQVLIGYGDPADRFYLRETGNELFIQKKFASKKVLKDNTRAGSHLAVLFQANDFLEKPALVKANFDKEKIVVETLLEPKKQFDLTDTTFNFASESMLSTGFSHEVIAVYNMIDSTVKPKLSRAAGFNIDSVLWNNTHSTVDITGIRSRVDSAITYTYDDNFNPLEQVVVNTIKEPVFCWKIYGKGTASTHQYWIKNGNIEQTTFGDLFLPVPFARSYCNLEPGRLSVATPGGQESTQDSLEAILFLHVSFNKIPSSILQYIPVQAKYLENLETLDLRASRQQDKIYIRCTLLKKNNSQPIIKW